jgi:NAD(P)-dependent dehydrogenase (short-subunit alcohol dehydrogenase family)
VESGGIANIILLSFLIIYFVSISVELQPCFRMTSPNGQRPKRSLTGKVALVTGAGAQGDGIGNGRATAILLAEDGCTVICLDVDGGAATRTAEMITADGHGAALALTCDVTSEAEVKAVVERVVRDYGRIDILVNIVGVGGARGTAVETDMVAWARGMEINVASMVITAKYCIPHMARNDGSRGYRGAIVNMASVAGLRGGTPHLLYPTSKGAIVNMTRAMASHHAKDGVRVNCVCPGMVYTPMMYGGGMTEEARESRKNRSLLKTEGYGWDVGAAVRFLCSEEAGWITGIDLPVDAGATCSVGSELPTTASVNP